jgi:hypothetical protein
MPCTGLFHYNGVRIARQALLRRLEQFAAATEPVDEEERAPLPALLHEELDPVRGQRRPGRLSKWHEEAAFYACVRLGKG